MASTPYKTLGNIRTAVVNDAKEVSSTALITQVNRWVNEGYEQVALRKKREWLDTQFTVQLQSAVQAVASVVNGSTTVTYATATLSALTVEKLLWSQGFNEVYNVSSITSPAVTLAKPYLGDSNTARTCVLAQPHIILDSSIRHIYQVYHQWSSEPLIEVGPQVMRQIQEQYGPQVDYARYCTIFGQDSTGSRRMIIYPYPDTAYTLYIDANTYVTPLSADADEPIIPMQHRQILYHFAMYKLFSYHRNDAKAAEYLGNFNAMLAKIDGEARAEIEFPQIKVSYRRGNRRSFIPGFDTRLREDP